MNKNLYFTLFYIGFFVIIIYLRYNIRKKTLTAKRIKGKIYAKWTTKYIFYIYLLILFGSFIEYFIVERKINLFLSITAFILYWIGISGRQWAFNSLGEYWSVDIEIRDDHKIIKKGPYRYMRHPNNFFHLLEVLGITLIPNSYYTSLIFIILYFPIIILRTIIEEKVMYDVLKNKYKEYKKETMGLFPLFNKKFFRE